MRRAAYLKTPKNRLYAFPSIPEFPPSDKIILDSGAFGAAKRGEKMDENYLLRLAEHYRSYGGSNCWPIAAIAPDVFQNPQKSMAQWQWWHKEIGLKVVPVLQYNGSRVDLYSIKKQIEFYSKSDCPIIALGNSVNFRANKASPAVMVLNLIRQMMGDVWVHQLGSGFNALD